MSAGEPFWATVAMWQVQIPPGTKVDRVERGLWYSKTRPWESCPGELLTRCEGCIQVFQQQRVLARQQEMQKEFQASPRFQCMRGTWFSSD